jgi:hypothetical protein
MIPYFIILIIGLVGGFFIGVNNPTAGAVAKKLAKQAQAAAAASVDKLKS